VEPGADKISPELVKHLRVLKVVAFSGGYARDEANKRLGKQHGVIGRFSRALTEALTAQQSDAEFNGAPASDRDHPSGFEVRKLWA